jgi:hypothetical protein
MHRLARDTARATAGAAVTLSAVVFTFAGGGAASAAHVPLYSNTAPYALAAAGHEDDAHVDFSYEFIYLPGAASSSTAVASRHVTVPNV